MLTIHVGGPWRLDVSPQFGVPLPLMQWSRGTFDAVTLPGVTFYDPNAPLLDYSASRLFPHELHHWEQQKALGPWFWAAYALSGGSVFEPHFATIEGQGWTGTWMPPTDMRDDYPIFRIGSGGFHAFPGY